jgi:hypothetical protein
MYLHKKTTNLFSPETFLCPTLVPLDMVAARTGTDRKRREHKAAVDSCKEVGRWAQRGSDDTFVQRTQSDADWDNAASPPRPDAVTNLELYISIHPLAVCA